MPLFKLKKELGKTKYDLITITDRREYREYAEKYNSLTDDLEDLEADVNRSPFISDDLTASSHLA